MKLTKKEVQDSESMIEEEKTTPSRANIKAYIW